MTDDELIGMYHKVDTWEKERTQAEIVMRRQKELIEDKDVMIKHLKFQIIKDKEEHLANIKRLAFDRELQSQMVHNLTSSLDEKEKENERLKEGIPYHFVMKENRQLQADKAELLTILRILKHGGRIENIGFIQSDGDYFNMTDRINDCLSKHETK